MSLPVDDLLQQALNLSGEDRLQLAEALLESVTPASAPPFDPEWLAEAKRRANQIDAGESQLSAWTDVRERAN